MSQPSWKTRKPMKLLYSAGAPTAKKATAIAKKALRVAKAGETKYSDQSIYNSFSTVTAGDIRPISLIAEGDTASTRDGNHIKALAYRYSMQINKVDSNSVNSAVRFIIFKDKESQGTVPTVTQLLITASIHSAFNPDNKARFRVYSDKLVQMGGRYTTGNMFVAPMAKILRATKKLNGVDIGYKGTTATQADANHNHIYVCTIGNDVNNELIMQSTLYYQDK